MIMLLFILVWTYFAIAFVKVQIDIYRIKASRKASPYSLYPSVFFEEVFSSCGKSDKLEIEEHQRKIEATQYLQAPDGNTAYFISEEVKDAEKKYEECLQNYLTNFLDAEKQRNAISQLKTKVELGRKIIEKEKEAFLSDNGEDTVSFNFNRQNYFTDLLLTVIIIPVLLDAMEWQAKNIKEFIDILLEKPMMHFMLFAFITILLYRIFKYNKNKRSMLRGMRQVVLYDKAELMLCAFECALNNIDNLCCKELLQTSSGNKEKASIS